MITLVVVIIRLADKSVPLQYQRTHWMTQSLCTNSVSAQMPRNKGPGGSSPSPAPFTRLF